MRRRPRFTLLALAPLLACSLAQAEQSELPTPKRELELPSKAFMKVYDNGLTLFVVPDEYTQLMQFDMRQQVGSRDDPAGKAGLAHLSEHLMFQMPSAGEGSPRVMTDIQRHALTFNAYTSADETHYMHTGAADELESYMKYTALRLNYDCNSVTDDTYLRERDVVRNEHRWRGESFDAEVYTQVQSAVFPEGHPYRGSPFAADTEMASVTPEEACAFIKRYYTASQSSIIITGAVDPQRVLALGEKYLEPLPKIETQPRSPVAEAAFKGGSVSIKAPVKKPTAVLLFKIPKRFSEDYIASQAALETLFLGVSFFTGRRGSAIENWYPATFGGKEASVFGIAIETKKAAHLDRAIDEVLDAIHRAFEASLKGKDYKGSYDEARQRARLRILSQIASVGQRSTAFADYLEEGDTPGFYGAQLAALDNLTAVHAQDVGRRVFARDKALVVKVVPDGSDAKAKAERADFDYKPNEEERLSLPNDVDPAEAQRPIEFDADAGPRQAKVLTLANGLRIVLVKSSGVPVMRLQLIVGAGTADAPGRPDLARLSARAFGPQGNDAGVLMNYFSFAGAAMGGGAGVNSTSFFASGMSIYLDFIVAALSEHVVQGEYRTGALENWKQRQKDLLKKEHFKLDAQRNNIFYEAIYGKGHPSVRPVITDASALRDIKLDDLEDFRDTHYRATNTVLIVTGGFDVDLARQYIERFFGEPKLRDRKNPWQEAKQSATHEKPEKPQPGEVRFITEIDDERLQTQVTIAYPFEEVYGPDHAAKLVLVSMLNFGVSKVRHELGSTYGIYAGLDEGRSLVQIGGALDSSRAGEALVAIRAQIDLLRSGEDFDRHFAFARREVLNSMIEARGDAELLARNIARAVQADQPYDYYDKLAAQVAALKPAQVKTEIDAMLIEADSVTMIQGPKEGIADVVAKVGIEGALKLPDMVHDED